MKVISRIFGLSFLLLSFSTTTFAGLSNLGASPVQLPNGLKCMDAQKMPLGLSNEQVLAWLKNTASNFAARALVKGVITKRYPDRTDHAHFAIDLNGDGQGDLEVIYQNGFGALPSLQPGTVVVACGDYITDHQHSPNGGIIHWVHCNPGDRDHGVHPSGFVMINGKVYGYQAPSSQPPCTVGSSLLR